MIYLLVASLYFLLPYKTAAQSHVDSLIKAGLYLSAYERLDDRDSLNLEQNLQKIDLALNYYLNCQYYRQFSFINLRNGEQLKELRKEKIFGDTPIQFNVDSTLLMLYKQFPEDYRIAKVLGDFYNRVYYDFGDSWGERAEVLLEKSNSYYIQAYEHGVFDEYSLYALGYYQSLFQNYFEAQNWFLKSLQLKSDVALTNYSLAVTYLFDGLPQKGIRYSQRAYDLYTDSIEKSDAARITGILYLKNQQLTEAIDFFERANLLNPNYKPNQMYLLKASLLAGEDSVCMDLGCKILLESPYAPEVPEEFNSMFFKEGKENLLCFVYDRALEQLFDNYEASGNIRFHYGKLFFKIGNKRKAKQMFKLSGKDFERVFESNHQVFDAIQKSLDRL